MLVTLVYLAFQVRSNTRALRANTFMGVTDGWQNTYDLVVPAETQQLFLKALARPEEIDTVEFGSFWMISRALFRRMENDFYQYRHRTFDQDSWDVYREAFRRDMWVHSSFRAMWRMQREALGRDFRELIDREIEATLADDSYIRERPNQRRWRPLASETAR